MELYIALVVLAGTTLLMVTSLRDLKLARELELQWWSTEDDLIAELPRWRTLARRRRRRELQEMRDPEVHTEIRHMSFVLAGWALLFLGSLIATLDAGLRP